MGKVSESAGSRDDLEAERRREEAALARVQMARSAARPQVGLQLKAATLWGGSSALGAFATLGLSARWDLFAPGHTAEVDAATRAADAAQAMQRWHASQVTTEASKARRAIEAAHARAEATREAVAAAENARKLLEARHREGLLPLTDLLEAETAVTAARTTFHEALFAERMGHAQLQLALGQSIEGASR